MIGADLLPRAWRRELIDRVYGAEDRKGLRIYLASIWGAALVALLILTGFTPWAWPAERNAPVPNMEQISCVAVLGEAGSGEGEPETNRSTTNSSRSKAKAGASAARGATACRQALSQAERAQLGRVEELVAYLQRGGTPPPALSLAPDSELRAWVDGNICRLGGAGSGERGALAWHVWQGTGECGRADKLMAQLPLSILVGPLLGVFLTIGLALWLLFALARHSLRLPATRRAYRRLYGSEHKAP